MHLTRLGALRPSANGIAGISCSMAGWMPVRPSSSWSMHSKKKPAHDRGPDWRGFGRSEWPQEGYGFPDYLGDFDGLDGSDFARFTGAALSVTAWGGNIANLYAGSSARACALRHQSRRARPAKNGRPAERAEAHAQMAGSDQESGAGKELQFLRATGLHHPIPLSAGFAPRSRLPFVARVWGRAGTRMAGCGWRRIRRHHWVNPIIYKREDAEATWREIRAPLLMITGGESDYFEAAGAGRRHDGKHWRAAASRC